MDSVSIDRMDRTDGDKGKSNPIIISNVFSYSHKHHAPILTTSNTRTENGFPENTLLRTKRLTLVGLPRL
jgi:hypothetical protein